MPTVEQIKGTLPYAFKEKYPTTYVHVYTVDHAGGYIL